MNVCHADAGISVTISQSSGISDSIISRAASGERASGLTLSSDL